MSCRRILTHNAAALFSLTFWLRLVRVLFMLLVVFPVLYLRGVVRWATGAAQAVAKHHASRLREVQAQLLEQLSAECGRPVLSNFVELSHGLCRINMHYVSTGPADGRLVLLVHGFPHGWSTWSKVIPKLASAGFRVIAPDLRGYGLTDRPAGIASYRVEYIVGDLVELIQKLSDEKRAIVVSHDWGGVISWPLARDYPQHVSRLIAINGPSSSMWLNSMCTDLNQLLKSWYVFFLQLPILPELVYLYAHPRGAESTMRSIQARDPKAFTELETQLAAASMSQPGALTAMLNYYRANIYRFFNLRERCASVCGSRCPANSAPLLTCPTRVLWGTNDEALELICLSKQALAELPGLQLVDTRPLSHWVPQSAPDWVAGHVLEASAELLPTRPNVLRENGSGLEDVKRNKK